MPAEAIAPTSRMRLDPRLLRGPVIIAAVSCLISFIIFLWPVTSAVIYDGKFTPTGSDGTEFCGVAITQIFVVPHGEADSLREKKIDCAAKARDFAGPGALFLLLGLVSTSLVLLTPNGLSGEVGVSTQRQASADR